MISVRGLEKGYGRFRARRRVLRGVDLGIVPGEVVGLLGANGSGKTTLLLCILGLLFPDSGEVTIDGARAGTKLARRAVGFVPEAAMLDPGLSTARLLLTMRELWRCPEPEHRTDELLARFGLTEFRDRRTGTLSRGLVQRLALCQAFLRRPRCMILDEPTSNLDPGGVLLVRREILNAKEAGATVLLSSHQLSEIERVCDRIVLLKDGRLREIDRNSNLESLFGDPS